MIISIWKLYSSYLFEIYIFVKNEVLETQCLFEITQHQYLDKTSIADFQKF